MKLIKIPKQLVLKRRLTRRTKISVRNHLNGMHSIDEVLGIAGANEAVHNGIYQVYNMAGPEIRKIVDFILHLSR